MVPADDDHKSANESEQTTPEARTLLEKLKFWKRDKKEKEEEEEEPARLTTLPKCLMHWLTPVWIAAAGFLIALAFAVNWRGEFHWPSAEAMKLCATIAGAGFAFSAWQQRSHDNVVKEKQAQATVERDDYWKRREQIYQLLGSENPGLRLSAVALLAELADSASHSNLLNKTEKQQLQRHIIDTLCLQLRHEGMSQTHEGSQNEHAEIQRAILDAIQMRINCNATRKDHAANWSTHHIRLTDTHFLTSIIIDNITTHSTIDLSNSDLQQTLQIKNSKIKHVIWNGTTFHNGVKIGGMDKPVTIEIDEIPQNSTETTFQNVTIITRKQTLTIRTNYDVRNDAPYPSTQFIECNFLSKDCPCPSECDCHTSNVEGECKCRHTNLCTCSKNCTESHIELIDDIPLLKPTRGALYIINNCHLNTIKIDLNNIEVSIKLIGNRIRNGIHMQFHNTRRADPQSRYPYIYHANRAPISPNIVIQDNIFRVNERRPPISISYNIAPTLSVPFIPALFDKNYITKADTFEKTHNKATSSRDHLHILHCEHNQPNIGQFHFRDAFSNDPKDHWITSWTAGYSTSEL